MINTTLRGTRYAGHGPVPGQLATVHRTGQNRKPGPRGPRGPHAMRTGKSGTAWQQRCDSFLLLPSFFHSTPGPKNRLPGTRHAATVSRSRFPGERGPPFPFSAFHSSAIAIDKRNSKRLKVYCADCASKSLRVQAGGRGCAGASAFFCIIITPRTTFFAISSPSVPRFPPLAGVTPRAWYRMREAVIDPRSVGVALCSVRYACCRMHKGLSRFYAVTRQAMIVTRDIHLTPAAMPINVYWSGTSRRASILCIRHAVLLLCRGRGTLLL
jgi:hypothetical protein